MKRPTGNQHSSRRGDLMAILHLARNVLKERRVRAAQMLLDYFWHLYARTPASTRRRWKCGR